MLVITVFDEFLSKTNQLLQHEKKSKKKRSQKERRLAYSKEKWILHDPLDWLNNETLQVEFAAAWVALRHFEKLSERLFFFLLDDGLDGSRVVHKVRRIRLKDVCLQACNERTKRTKKGTRRMKKPFTKPGIKHHIHIAGTDRPALAS